MDSLYRGQWHGALMFALICTWTNDPANNRDSSDLRCHHAHYDVTEMYFPCCCATWEINTKIILLWVLNSLPLKSILYSVTLFGQVELTTWLSSFKYQYTRKFLYQPRKWIFGQPARKLSVDPWYQNKIQHTNHLHNTLLYVTYTLYLKSFQYCIKLITKSDN